MGMPTQETGLDWAKTAQNVSSFWILLSCVGTVRSDAENFSDTSVLNGDDEFASPSVETTLCVVVQYLILMS
jgi:hypothetical protein